MTLSAPTRLNPRRSFGPANVTRQGAPAQRILMVEFVSPDGRTCQAVGGGDTLADSVAFARDSCPTNATWQPIRWTDVYGD